MAVQGEDQARHRLYQVKVGLLGRRLFFSCKGLRIGSLKPYEPIPWRVVRWTSKSERAEKAQPKKPGPKGAPSHFDQAPHFDPDKLEWPMWVTGMPFTMHPCSLKKRESHGGFSHASGQEIKCVFPNKRRHCSLKGKPRYASI